MVFGREVELGFASFKEKENPFTSITRFGSSPLFGGPSNSSSSSSPSFPNNPPANTTGNVAGIPSGLFGMPTINSLPTTSSASVTTQPFVFGPCRDTHPPKPLFSSSQNSTSAFHQRIFNPFSVSQTTGGQQSSGWSPFPSASSRNSNGGFLFGVPFPSSSTTSFGFSTASSTGPFTQSLVQENNTSSNSVSVFAPFTRSNVRVSDIRGTKLCSYAPTPAAEDVGIDEGKLCSISAMPMYKEKSHEELRLEDYQLSCAIRSFGFTNTSSTNSFSLGPLVSTTCTSHIATSSLPGISGIQGTRICSFRPTPVVDYGYGELNSISGMPFYMKKSHEELRFEDYQLPSLIPTPSSSTTGAIPSFSISNTSSSNSVPVGPSVSTTCTYPIATSSLPLHRPVISVPLSIEIRHLGDLLATSQITIPVPASGTVPASNCPTVNESIITSIPEPVSTGGFHWPPYNRQTPVKPVATEARTTFPTTETYGISGLPDSDNGGSRPAIEKYKPDDEDAIKYRKILDVMAIVPKLNCPDYYTVPSMDDLITNELKRPGFCSQVKDFEIGKRGYGCIKFLGETDVRNLDLESMVRFNTREVIFWMDKKAKPPIGQGLNKAAEITLNVHCIDKNTGKQYIDGPKVDKYKQLLVRKTMEQGAEFVSFDPVKGEWKFMVQHF